MRLKLLLISFFVLTTQVKFFAMQKNNTCNIDSAIMNGFNPFQMAVEQELTNREKARSLEDFINGIVETCMFSKSKNVKLQIADCFIMSSYADALSVDGIISKDVYEFAIEIAEKKGHTRTACVLHKMRVKNGFY